MHPQQKLFACLAVWLAAWKKLDFDVKFIHNTAINQHFMSSKPLNSDKNDTGGGNQDCTKKGVGTSHSELRAEI